jgi:Family of unknown function (DUF6502)
MQNSRAGRAMRPVRKRTKASVGPREVDPNEVVQNLLGLFEHLGIDVTHPISRGASIGSINTVSHTLYPYASAIGELLTSWHRDPEYLDNEGNPLAIRALGRRPSFRKLAQRAVPEIDESYLLSELERLGAVTIDKNKLIHVHMRSFPVYEDKRLAAQHTLSALNDFIGTLSHNLDSTPSNSEQLFHRIAWNGDFDPREIPALKIRMKRQGQSFLESFDNWLTRKTLAKSRKPSDRIKRAEVSIGIYLSVQRT